MCYVILFQSQYEKFKEIKAAQGVKIIAKDLEKSLAGLPMHVAEKQDEILVYRVKSYILLLSLGYKHIFLDLIAYPDTGENIPDLNISGILMQ